MNEDGPIEFLFEMYPRAVPLRCFPPIQVKKGYLRQCLSKVCAFDEAHNTIADVMSVFDDR